jgi:hypothetical protein
MNERIRELAKQATLPGYMLGESYVQSRLDEQKFAELIVRECVGIVDGYYFKPTEVADLIRNHFGVDE